MDTIDEKVGYLIAKVDTLAEDYKATSGKLDALEQRVNEKFQTAETTLRVLGWLAGGLVAVVSVPWTAFILFVKRLFA